MVRVVFQQVVVKGVFRWTDDTGKKRQQTEKFMQTINPFNKGADGFSKGYAQIRSELLKERDLWLLKKQNDHRDYMAQRERDLREVV